MEYIRLGKMDFKNRIGDRVFVTFLSRDVSVRLQKDKVTKFVVFNMVDKETVIEARLFGATDQMIEMIQEGRTYNAAVDVKPYDKSPQGYSCIIYNMEYSSVSPESFADWAENLDQAKKIIEDALGKIYQTYYGQIAYPLVIDYWNKFSKWTAASNQHHTQLGGLLRHTAEVVEICEMLADYFNSLYSADLINKPLLIASAILHDLGKTLELDVNTSSGKTEYSQHSILSTHIMDILGLVELKARELGIGYNSIIGTEENEVIQLEKSQETIEYEKEAVALLKHCLAAHHGKLEYGSPITASIPEAYLLNIADNIDAEMYKFNRALKELEPGDYSAVWGSNGYNKFYKELSKVDGTIEGD